ncbi:HigA family addiction module antitoxin [Fructilactobacillus carniphilus]|uniref:HigA family addiction module antitoxin n=1 Tax=Fructilactobacillus carniphilus TaxID=2940297 RepID=A0ABY5BXR0_9LACO|nr:HigA family addiction module antitoxin [Fructilactobacillus carniphilus]USS91297.1 HigA family addiction module antitoxin [Fructilactobacillus carniphilus]
MNDAVKITMGDILKEEFMIPYKLSASKLARDIDVPTSRIQDILHDRRKISLDTSIRLGKYFGASETYFLNMQNSVDLRNLDDDAVKEYTKIKPIKHLSA